MYNGPGVGWAILRSPSSQCNIPKGFPSLLCSLGRGETVVPKSPSRSALAERDQESAIHSNEVLLGSFLGRLQLTIFQVAALKGPNYLPGLICVTRASFQPTELPLP